MAALPEAHDPGRSDRRGRVLVVDDSEPIRELMAALLKRRGYDVVTVGDGETAIDEARGDVGLVLLDLTLPGMTGLDVCRRLRADPATAEVPIVVLSGRLEPGDVRDAIRAGADAYLTKPFDTIDLLAVLTRMERRRLS